MYFRVFFFFSCLFVLPSFKAQTNNDSLPKCHNIEHNPVGRWRLCGVVWTSMQRHSIDVHATLFGRRLLARSIPCYVN